MCLSLELKSKNAALENKNKELESRTAKLENEDRVLKEKNRGLNSRSQFPSLGFCGFFGSEILEVLKNITGIVLEPNGSINTTTSP